MQAFDVIVVGGGITGLTAAYRAHQKRLRVLLLEAGPTCGGAIHSQTRQGALLEGGPDSLLAHKPAALELIRELGLQHDLVPSGENLSTFVLRQERLWPLPDGFRQIAPTRLLPTLLTPLLSWRAKFRMLLEPFVPPTSAQDETLASFVRRRLGAEVLDRLVQPLVAGIFAADPEKLSLQATFPFFLQMEREHGSLIRALWKSPPRPVGMLSLKQGLGQLIESLEKSLPAGTVQCRTRVDLLQPHGDGWLVGSGRTAWRAERVVLALTAPQTSSLLAPLDPALARSIGAVRCRDTAVLNQLWRPDQVQAPRASGVVVPLKEGWSFSACSFPQWKWPGRSGSWVSVRMHLGGAGREATLKLPERELIEHATEELRRLLGWSGQPHFSWLRVHQGRMPEYALGHRERVARVEQALQRWPGLQLGGNWLRGVGIADCILGANQMAQEWPRKETICLQ